MAWERRSPAYPFTQKSMSFPHLAFSFQLLAFSFPAYHVAQSAKIFSRPSSDRSFDLLNSLETMPL